MPRNEIEWDWPYERPPWQPFPQREPTSEPRAPGHFDEPMVHREAHVIAASEGEDTFAIEEALQQLLDGGGSPPSQPPKSPPEPPWSHDEGTDKCAWYYSFRYGRPRFGIYICIECLDQITRILWHYGLERSRAQRVAFAFLYGHERFHYRVDRGVEILERSLEVATGDAVQLWLQYWVKTRYHTPGRGLDLLEEACANQHGLSAAVKEASFPYIGKSKRKRPEAEIDRDKVTTRKVLSEMMKHSAPGYKDFDKIDGRVGLAQDELMSWYLLINSAGTGRPVGPVEGVSMVIPRPVKRGNLNTDPELPLRLVKC